MVYSAWNSRQSQCNRSTTKKSFLGFYLQKSVLLLPCKLFTCLAIVFPAKSSPFELIWDLDRSYKSGTKNPFFFHTAPQNPQQVTCNSDVPSLLHTWVCLSYIKDTSPQHDHQQETHWCIGTINPQTHSSLPDVSIMAFVSSLIQGQALHSGALPF